MNPSVLIRANHKKLCRISTSNAEFGTAKFAMLAFPEKIRLGSVITGGANPAG